LIYFKNTQCEEIKTKLEELQAKETRKTEKVTFLTLFVYIEQKQSSCSINFFISILPFLVEKVLFWSQK
jgi:hypothetical protein